jgi:hypothetical protein
MFMFNHVTATMPQVWRHPFEDLRKILAYHAELCDKFLIGILEAGVAIAAAGLIYKVILIMTALNQAQLVLMRSLH